MSDNEDNSVDNDVQLSYYERNRERILKRQKLYYEKNKERIKAQNLMSYYNKKLSKLENVGCNQKNESNDQNEKTRRVTRESP